MTEGMTEINLTRKTNDGLREESDICDGDIRCWVPKIIDVLWSVLWLAQKEDGLLCR